MLKKFLLILTVILTVNLTFADEGMFPLNELNHINYNKLKKMGLNLTYDQIRNDISKAVVSLGGGTGSFVSKDGLIITNHHVAYRAIQYNASAKHNYIKEGFYADSFEKELPAPGYYADIILDIVDVTNRIKSKLNDKMTDKERYETIENEIKKIEKETEAKEKNIRAEVAAFYGGKQFLLFKKMRLQDIRLVYAPPESIGAFGGDIDNFEWPRHDGDFSFLRAYVDKNGNPAPYSKDNVPYHPKHFLKIAFKPLKTNDFAFILGFPGHTDRYMTGKQIDLFLNQSIPLKLKLFTDIINMMEEEGKKNPELNIKVAFWVKALNNTKKYYEGVQAGLKRDKVVDKFYKRDKEIEKWIAKNNDMLKYKNAIPEMNKIAEQINKIEKTLTIMGYSNFVSTFGAGATIGRWAEEKKKPDLKRDPAFMERNIPRRKRRLETMQRDLIPELDKTMLSYFMKRFADLPENERPETFKKYFGNGTKEELYKKIDKTLDEFYKTTKLTDKNTRLKYFDMSEEQLKKVNDKLLHFAWDFADELKEKQDNLKGLNGKVMRIKPQVIEVINKFTGKELYPDANSTLRFTYGKICGYSPRDAVWYKPFTTLKGAIEKETGKEPFANPKKLIELYEKKDFGEYYDKTLGGVPLDFLTDNDTTGGNSGSPTLNGNGEIIGLLFDGNFESISSDYYFNPALTRSVVVDSRYILFILDKFSNAQRIIKELTIVK
ncbi:peptidase S46 [Thermotomaculum hydrothermale]|uniref:Dipeptidyl-peptidase n=1 Tax=Thermotomaculum hydrothermale TaxID=981385 RepID=A0A7R6PML9_9BACT|nr:S46 family peptidase [Thermotomaculum hydrothermale]BBB32887.1 peptidase S46 [Thermotomaculum hydrothermale]